MDGMQREYLRREIDRRRREETRLSTVVRRANTRMALKPPENPHLINEVMIPARVVWDAIEAHAKRNGWGDTENMISTEVARRTGYDEKRLVQLKRQRKVSFDVADYIVTRVYVRLWWEDAALNEAYEAMDFRWYDPEWVALRRRRASRVKAEKNRRSRIAARAPRFCKYCGREIDKAARNNVRTCSKACASRLYEIHRTIERKHTGLSAREKARLKVEALDQATTDGVIL